MIFSLLLVIYDQVLNDYFLTQGIVFSIVICALCPLLLIIFAINKRQSNYTVSIDKVDLLFFLYILLFLINALKLDHYDDNLTVMLFSIAFYTAVKCIANYSSKPRPFNVDNILVLILILAVSESILGLYQLLEIMILKKEIIFIKGSFFNSGLYGVFLSSILPFSVYFYNLKFSRNIRLLTIICFLIILIAIFFSGSRTAILSVTVSALVLLITEKKLRKTYRITLILLLPIILVLVVYSMIIIRPESVAGRFLVWKIAAQMIYERPIYGWGISGFDNHVGHFIASYFSKARPEQEIQLIEKVTFVFNDYLQILIENGVIGFSIFIGIILTVFTCKRSDSSTMYVKISLLAILTSCLSSYPLQFLPTWLVFCSLLSLMPKQKSLLQIKVKRTYLLIFVLLFSLFSLLAGFNLKTIYVNKILSYKATNLFHEGKYFEALEIYGVIEGVLSYDYKMMMPYAKTLLVTGNPRKSLSVTKTVQKYHCDPYLYIIRGDALSELWQIKLAKESYIYASKIDPKLMFAKFKLAQFLYKNKQVSSAKVIAKEILGMKIKVKSEATNHIQAESLKILAY